MHQLLRLLMEQQFNLVMLKLLSFPRGKYVEVMQVIGFWEFSLWCYGFCDAYEAHVPCEE